MTEITSNGSKFAGEQPDSIEELIKVLRTEPLDPVFEEYGNFVNRTPHFLHKEAQEKYNGCAQIFGNFAFYSHVFNILTDDAELIDSLEKLIRENQETESYIKARKEQKENEALKKKWHEENFKNKTA